MAKMISALVMMALTFTVLGFSVSALADDCPVQIGTANYIDQVVAQIQAADSCYSGDKLAESCSMGSSGDVAIAGAAQTKCEADFVKKAAKADLTTYKALGLKCTDKYKNMQGTMYIGANAFCHLQVSALYSELFTPAE